MTGGEFSAETLAQTFTGGAGLGFGFFAIRWLAVFMSGRFDTREAQLDAATKATIERLEQHLEKALARLDKVEADLAECREKHADAEAELKSMRAVLNGQASMRNEAQVLIAADHISRKGREG